MDPPNLMHLEVWQRAMISITRSFSGCLSFAGSVIIIYMVLKRKDRTRPTYDRILFAASIYDSLHALFSAIPSTLMVDEASGGWGCLGNRATCSASGFFLQLSGAVVSYTACLSICFLLTIRFDISDDVLARYYEPWFHVISFLQVVPVATYGVISGRFNALLIPELGCWINSFPLYCQFLPHVDCTRGSDTLIVFWNFTFFWFALDFIVVIVCNILIFLTVWKQERRMRIGRNDERRFSGNLNRELSNRKLRSVARQNVLYGTATFFTAIWPTIPIIAAELKASNTSIFWLSWLFALLYPSVGLFNLFIYLYPKLARIRRSSSVLRSSVHLVVDAILDRRQSFRTKTEDTSRAVISLAPVNPEHTHGLNKHSSTTWRSDIAATEGELKEEISFTEEGRLQLQLQQRWVSVISEVETVVSLPQEIVNDATNDTNESCSQQQQQQRRQLDYSVSTYPGEADAGFEIRSKTILGPETTATATTTVAPASPIQSQSFEDEPIISHPTRSKEEDSKRQAQWIDRESEDIWSEVNFEESLNTRVDMLDS